MIFAVKQIAIFNQIVECGKNTKSLVNILTGVKKLNPMPENVKDQELLDNYPDYFLRK